MVGLYFGWRPRWNVSTMSMRPPPQGHVAIANFNRGQSMFLLSRPSLAMSFSTSRRGAGAPDQPAIPSKVVFLESGDVAENVGN